MRAALAAGLALACVCASVPASAQSFGRLFLTPDERATLDERRRNKVPDKPPEVAVEVPTARIQGQVLRSSGRSTVWIDGRPLRDGAQPDGLRIAPYPGNPGRVEFGAGKASPRSGVGVGDVVNRDTGEVRRLVPGEWSVSRPGGRR